MRSPTTTWHKAEASAKSARLASLASSCPSPKPPRSWRSVYTVDVIAENMGHLLESLMLFPEKGGKVAQGRLLNQSKPRGRSCGTASGTVTFQTPSQSFSAGTDLYMPPVAISEHS
jgi:hypothetical protein